MRIGRVTIDPPVMLAPMSGINDRPFRLLCRQLGASAVWTGLISANAFRYDSQKTADLLTFWPEEHPVCAQVFGANPEFVAAAAAEAERRGADLVDINMGCSVPKVLKGGAGVALMADPARAEAMVRACVAAVRIPVVVKMRTGWPDQDESAVALAPRCERAGAAAVTVHGRFAGQRFRGQADWSVIAAVTRAVSIPVIGSGDIRHADDAVHLLAETGCEGVMVGRAALGNPWLFREIAAALTGRPIPPPPTPDERLALAERHTRLAISDRGPKVGVREMRKHLSWYLKGMPMARALRDRVNHASTEDEVMDLLVCARIEAAQAPGQGG